MNIQRLLILTLLMAGLTFCQTVNGQAIDDTHKTAPSNEEKIFADIVQPLFKKYCFRCHNEEEMKSGVRLDHLTAVIEERHFKLWSHIAEQLVAESMPPDEAPQPTAEERKSLTVWIERNLAVARARPTPRSGSVRRLTVAQYRNTLRDLLGLQEDFTDVLPPDGISKDGFTNQEQTLTLSPLQIEAYFDIAEKALAAAIVHENQTPTIQSFRMEFGTKINKNPCPDKLILGANSELLNNADFVVTETTPNKPFPFQPFRMRTAYDFIEGYEGNDTVRGWRKFDGIYHSVFACVRGTPGYPKGEAYEVAANGLLLRPAIPSPEIFGQSNTYGPMANFKISLRELPDAGNFRVTVTAARYDDALLLDRLSQVAQSDQGIVKELSASGKATLTIQHAGIYQIDVVCKPGNSQDIFSLWLGDRQVAGKLSPEPSVAGSVAGASAASSSSKNAGPKREHAFAVIRLSEGEHAVTAKYGDNSQLERIVFTRLADDSRRAQRFHTFEQRAPLLGVHVGLRRDCGSTLTQVGPVQSVSTNELHEYVFEGAIRDFPSPDVERGNVNYLAGIREIGVRSEYTDGRDRPRLLIQSIAFEGPFLERWPPATHRNIFIESAHRDEPAKYARDIIRSFATKAFRRPINADEEQVLAQVWQDSFDKNRNFQESVRDTLLVVLTSPQFLFLIEKSAGPQAEESDSYELAAKLSYFLWNTAPDQRLLDLAAKNELGQTLDTEIDRLLKDPRFGQCVQEFASQWLSLDKFDVVAVDANRYPNLTRDAKKQLRQEPVEFLRYGIEQNLPLENLLQSDFVMANEVIADYYQLVNRSEQGLQFVPIKHTDQNLGGLLTQAAILAGLSDGREANPVKRGAWLARKIIAEPPDDPPPNIPQLRDDDGSQLTLRQKLERHRNQEGCTKCHAGIDPWGVPFERFDAAGRFQLDPSIDARSTLPDGTEIADLNQLKEYLVEKKIDQVAYSFLKHLTTYATGRSLTYNELVSLREEGIKLGRNGYRLQDMLRFVVRSDSFMKK